MMKKKKKNGIKNYVLIAIVILVVLFIAYFCFRTHKTDSAVEDKEQVLEYLNSHYNGDSFKIGDREVIKVKGPTGSIRCGYNGYSWSVESKKTGVKFEVYDDIIGFVINSSDCSRGINDSYYENVYNSIKDKYGLDVNEYSDRLVVDLRKFNSVEEASTFVYEIITKYNLSLGYFDINIELKDDTSSIVVDPVNIKNSNDIVAQYDNFKHN